MPDRNELQSIVDYDRVDPAADPAAFPAISPDLFWSSSSNRTWTNQAWAVLFGDGCVSSQEKGGSAFGVAVRCVRGGAWFGC